MRAALVVTLLVSLSGLLPGATGALSASEFGTAAEAQALLDRAVVAVKAGEAAALAKFNKGEDGFRDRDLYVFCVNASDGKTTSHASPNILGQDVRSFKDKSGKAFGEEIYRGAQEGRVAKVRYVWPRPGTDAPVPKESLITRVGGQICGVGYYQ